MHASIPARVSFAVALVAAASACDVPYIDTSEEAAEAVRAQELGTLPHHPIAYHLDLSIFAYQLYGQTPPTRATCCPFLAPAAGGATLGVAGSF